MNNVATDTSSSAAASSGVFPAPVSSSARRNLAQSPLRNASYVQPWSSSSYPPSSRATGLWIKMAPFTQTVWGRWWLNSWIWHAPPPTVTERVREPCRGFYQRHGNVRQL